MQILLYYYTASDRAYVSLRDLSEMDLVKCKCSFAPIHMVVMSICWLQGVVLCTVGGMRGSLCLIMVQTVVLDMGNPGSVRDPDKMNAVKSALLKRPSLLSRACDVQHEKLMGASLQVRW